MIRNLDRVEAVQGVSDVRQYEEDIFGFRLHIDQFKKYQEDEGFDYAASDVDQEHSVEFIVKMGDVVKDGCGLFVRPTISFVQGEAMHRLGPFPHLNCSLIFANGAEGFFERDPDFYGAARIRPYFLQRYLELLGKTYGYMQGTLYALDGQTLLSVRPDSTSQNDALQTASQHMDALSYVFNLKHMCSIVHPQVNHLVLFRRTGPPSNTPLSSSILIG